MNVFNKNSIDAKAGDLELFLSLAEIIPKYPCCYKEKYPNWCNHRTCGKWHSISTMLKLKPNLCKKRWNTLKRHFCRGLLTNKQLIDKLQFLNDDNASRTHIDRLIPNLRLNGKTTSEMIEVAKICNEENAKRAFDIETNGGYDSDLELIEPFVETIEIADDYDSTVVSVV